MAFLLLVCQETGQVSRVELAAVQAERDRLSKTAEDMKMDYESQIKELKQQNAGWRNAGREKIDGLESQIQGLETENKDLKQRVETLIQNNLAASQT